MSFTPQDGFIEGIVQHKLRQETGAPDPSSLVEGEIAVGDTTSNGDEAIYYGVGKDSSTGKATGIVTIKTGSGSGSGTAVQTVQLLNRDTVTLYPGMAVRLFSTGVGIVRWDGSGTFAGIVITTTEVGYNATIQTLGPLTLSSWTVGCGYSNLIIGPVWLDNTNVGRICFAAPTTGTCWCIGYTAGPKILSIAPQIPLIRAS